VDELVCLEWTLHESCQEDSASCIYRSDSNRLFDLMLQWNKFGRGMDVDSDSLIEQVCLRRGGGCSYKDISEI
jgi:hypothetical protein